MCLAVPMKIIALTSERSGTVELEGAQLQVDLSLVEAPAVGEFVIVHAGYAIEKLDPGEAEERLALFAELAQSFRDEPGPSPGG